MQRVDVMWELATAHVRTESSSPQAFNNSIDTLADAVPAWHQFSAAKVRILSSGLCKFARHFF